ncbi:MAG: YceI family protein [Hyphomicrobiaceae bacterium]|nr:YceI family protein [Hyphomicrobiaceae bacterium]
MTMTPKRKRAPLLAIMTVLSLGALAAPAQACLFYKTTFEATKLWGLPEVDTSAVQAVLPANVSTCIEGQLPGPNGEQWGRVSFYLSDEIRYSVRGWVNLARFDKKPTANEETSAAKVSTSKAPTSHTQAPETETETETDADDTAMIDTLQAQQRELEQLKKKNKMLEMRMKEKAGKSAMKHMDAMKPGMMQDGDHGSQMKTKMAHMMKKGESARKPAADPDFLKKGWRLNGSKSKLRVDSVLDTSLIESHHFTNLTGSISRDGKAMIKVALNALDTGDKMRNVRVAHLLFQSDKFPLATITAKLDKTQLSALVQTGKQLVDLDFMLKLHGLEKKIRAKVRVTRMKDGRLQVASIRPIILSVADFALGKGITKLIEVAGVKNIIPAVPVRFNFIFDARS